MNLQHIYIRKRNKTLAAIDYTQITTIERESTGWSVRLLNRRARIHVDETREEILAKIDEAIAYKERRIANIQAESMTEREKAIKDYESQQKELLNTPEPTPRYYPENRKPTTHDDDD